MASSSWNDHINPPPVSSSFKWRAHVHFAVLLENYSTPVVQLALVPRSRVFHFPAREGAPIDTCRGCTLNTHGLGLDCCRVPRQARRSSRRSHLFQPQKVLSWVCHPSRWLRQPPWPTNSVDIPRDTLHRALFQRQGRRAVFTPRVLLEFMKIPLRVTSNTHSIAITKEHISHQHRRLSRTRHDSGTGRNTSNIASPTISCSRIAPFQRPYTISLLHIEHFALSFLLLAFCLCP